MLDESGVRRSEAERDASGHCGAEVIPNELTEILAPDKESILVMLSAYFDESEHTESGWFCIAGYAFQSRLLRRFNKEWKRLLGARKLHMKDLVHGHRDFKGIQPPERDRLLDEAANIISRTAAFGAVAFCQASEIKAALDTCSVDVLGFNNPFSFCHHYCMASMGKWSRENSAGRIAYIFSNGYVGKHGAYQLMEDVKKYPALRKPFKDDSYQCLSHTFAESEDYLPLQAADMLGYEWVRNWRLRATEKPRESFSALFKGRPMVDLMPIYRDDVIPLLRLLESLAPPE